MTKNKKEKRNSPDPYKGYTYQRLYAIYRITELMKDENEMKKWNIYEEDKEDVKLVKNEQQNKITEVIQLKYYNSTTKTESITQSSGFYKVFVSHYSNNDINKILYLSVNEKYGQNEIYSITMQYFINLQTMKDCDTLKKFLIKAFSDGSINVKSNENKTEDEINKMITKKIQKININKEVKKITDEYENNKKNDMDKYNNELEELKNKIKIKKLKKDIKKISALENKINELEKDINKPEYVKFMEWIKESTADVFMNYINKITIDRGEIYDEIMEKIKNNISNHSSYKEKFNKLKRFDCNKNMIDSHILCIYGLLHHILVDELFHGKNGTSIIAIFTRINDIIQNIKEIELLIDCIDFIIKKNDGGNNENEINKYIGQLLHISFINGKFQSLLGKFIIYNIKINDKFIPYVFNIIMKDFNYNLLNDKHVIGFLNRYYEGNITGYNNIDRNDEKQYTSMTDMEKVIKQNLLKQIDTKNNNVKQKNLLNKDKQEKYPDNVNETDFKNEMKEESKNEVKKEQKNEMKEEPKPKKKSKTIIVSGKKQNLKKSQKI